MINTAIDSGGKEIRGKRYPNLSGYAKTDLPALLAFVCADSNAGWNLQKQQADEKMGQLVFERLKITPRTVKKPYCHK